MERDFTEREKAFRYLVSEASEAERATVEERFFADEDFSRLLDDAETDLIDEYARGELSDSRRRNFERNFLVSERRRERVRTAQILQNELFGHSKAAPAAPKISLWEKISGIFRLPNLAWAGGVAAVLILFLLGGMWLKRQPENSPIVRNDDANQKKIDDKNQMAVVTPAPSPTPEIINTDSGAPNQTPAVNNPVEKQNIENKANNQNVSPRTPPIRQTPPAPRQPTFAAFTLLPPTRSAAKPVLIVPATAESIRLRIVHDNAEEFVRYRAEIRSSDGDLIWSREIPVTKRTLSAPLALDVRRGALASGSYELTLSGITADRELEEINFYNFSIQKK